MKHLTIQEIKDIYPNMWIGISNVEYGADHSIIAADVVYTDKTASELGLMSLNGQDIEPFFTTPDNVFQLGVMGD
ncbi:MAG: hypothetical protein K6E85_09020 [Lachnospiraceae bacterium]|nr:hypothetical protein [Lachnospiraceae bacterium]